MIQDPSQTDSKWSKKGVQPVTGMGVAGSVIRIEGGLPENSDSIPGRPADDNASVAAHSSGSAAEASDHIADSSKPCSGAFDRTGGQFSRAALAIQTATSDAKDRRDSRLAWELAAGARLVAEFRFEKLP